MDGKQVMDQVKAIKSGNGSGISTAKGKAALSGGFIGFGAGVYLGWAKKQNILVVGLTGAIIGAIAARVIMPK